MADISVSVSAGRMGRPPLGNKATNIRLSPDQMARIDALTGGGNRRAPFIRDAINEKLDREEAARKLRPNAE